MRIRRIGAIVVLGTGIALSISANAADACTATITLGTPRSDILGAPDPKVTLPLRSDLQRADLSGELLVIIPARIGGTSDHAVPPKSEIVSVAQYFLAPLSGGPLLVLRDKQINVDQALVAEPGGLFRVVDGAYRFRLTYIEGNPDTAVDGKVVLCIVYSRAFQIPRTTDRIFRGKVS